MKTPLAITGLVGQKQALDAYFDALFKCEAAVPTPAIVPVTEAPKQVEPVAGPTAVPGADDAAVAGTRQQDVTCVAAGSVRVQIFEVAGLTLAVPLERLQAVAENHVQLADASVCPQSVAGTVTWNGGQVPVVDTARLVLPEERAAKLIAETAQRCCHQLIIDNGRWALGCSGIAEVVELTDAEVTWRTAAGKRPWLAGMAAQRRCALLDVDGLIGLLESSMA